MPLVKLLVRCMGCGLEKIRFPPPQGKKLGVHTLTIELAPEEARVADRAHLAGIRNGIKKRHCGPWRSIREATYEDIERLTPPRKPRVKKEKRTEDVKKEA